VVLTAADTPPRFGKQSLLASVPRMAFSIRYGMSSRWSGLWVVGPPTCLLARRERQPPV
jgi:hypothetical protein